MNCIVMCHCLIEIDGDNNDSAIIAVNEYIIDAENAKDDKGNWCCCQCIF